MFIVQHLLSLFSTFLWVRCQIKEKILRHSFPVLQVIYQNSIRDHFVPAYPRQNSWLSVNVGAPDIPFWPRMQYNSYMMLMFCCFFTIPTNSPSFLLNCFLVPHCPFRTTFRVKHVNIFELAPSPLFPPCTFSLREWRFTTSPRRLVSSNIETRWLSAIPQAELRNAWSGSWPATSDPYPLHLLQLLFC